MVRAGETGGALETVLARLAEYLESQVRLRNKVGSILIYPAVMFGFALVVVAALTGWTLGSGEWRRMEERLQDLEEKARGALPEHQRFKRDRFRAMHLEAWQQGTPDWLEYAVELGGFAPDQSRIVFDQLSGALDPAYARLVKEPQREPRMVVRRGVRINLEGEARDRTGVEGLRESLVRDSRLNLESIGSEKTGGRRLPIPFSFLLRQGDGENKGSAKPPAGASGGASGGASQGQAAPGGAANAAPASAVGRAAQRGDAGDLRHARHDPGQHSRQPGR
jgi:hypothetical protein